jgi:hypothetical protein
MPTKEDLVMGNGRWDPSDWGAYASANVAGKSQTQVFTSRSLKDNYDPKLVARRESRDSVDNPLSTPIILASDVTGSMGMIAHTLMQDGLNTLATAIYDRKPVTDPHIMGMAIGDAMTDRAPLQVTQFEADIRLADQMKDLWIEGGGGGNGGESYALAHLFAAHKTVSDAFEKRGRKGYLFTIGDEPIHQTITAAQARNVMGLSLEGDVTAAQAVALASRSWEVFHIVLTNEGDARHNLAGVLDSWSRVLPERVIQLSDVNSLAETVVSIIQVHEGANAAQVAKSWSGSTAVAVAGALGSLPSRVAGTKGLRRLA